MNTVLSETLQYRHVLKQNRIHTIAEKFQQFTMNTNLIAARCIRPTLSHALVPYNLHFSPAISVLTELPPDPIAPVSPSLRPCYTALQCDSSLTYLETILKTYIKTT